MALTKCKECGHEISKSAKACPGCGAVVKRTSLFTKFVAGFIGVVVFFAFFGSCLERQGQADREYRESQAEQQQKMLEGARKKQAEENARVEAMTPEQRAAEDKRKLKLLQSGRRSRPRPHGTRPTIWLMQLSEQDRRVALARLVESSEEPCGKATKTFFQGLTKKPIEGVTNSMMRSGTSRAVAVSRIP